MWEVGPLGNFSSVASGGGGGGLDPATTAWVAAVVAAGGTVSGPRQTIVDTFIKALKSAGLWTTLDRYWLFAGENQIQSTVDFKVDEVISLLGAPPPAWSSTTGFTGGSPGYLRTAVVPSVGGLNYILNSATVGGQVQNNRLTDSALAGAWGAGNTAFDSVADFLPKFAGVAQYQINSNSSDNQTTSTAQGSWITTRTGAGAEAIYRNGGAFGTGTAAAAVSLPDGNFLVHAVSQGGNTPAAFGAADDLTSFFIGGGWNATQAANFETAQNAMMTSLGINLH